jgi:hypothetical protein
MDHLCCVSIKIKKNKTVSNKALRREKITKKIRSRFLTIYFFYCFCLNQLQTPIISFNLKDILILFFC